MNRPLDKGYSSGSTDRFITNSSNFLLDDCEIFSFAKIRESMINEESRPVKNEPSSRRNQVREKKAVRQQRNVSSVKSSSLANPLRRKYFFRLVDP